MVNAIQRQDDFEVIESMGVDNVNVLIGELIDASLSVRLFGNVIGKTAEYVPTEFSIMANAFDLYDEFLFNYAINGCFPELMDQIEMQFQQDETPETIIEGWREFREYNNSFGIVPPKDSIEMAYIRDIQKMLIRNNISFLDNGFKGDIYNEPGNEEYEWVNQPLIGVW